MKEKLLVLDDEPLILSSLDHLFEDDYEVFTTSEAETALRRALEYDVAVILCDERMPGVSGHEFLRRAREVSRATRVMMSGYADINALTEAVNSGQIFAYIHKPWESLELKSKVAAATSQFKLVQEVQQERALLRALMENIPDPIYFKDRQSRFTRVNQAYARMLDAKDSAECIGKSDADYFAPEDAIRWRAREEEIVRSGQLQVELIEQLESPQRGLRWMSTTKAPMFDRNGQVSGIAGISRDITALKNSEEMLRVQNEHNRMILETASDAFIGMDADGLITAWNPRAELTFGWAAAEVMGRRFSDTVVAPADRAAHGHGVEHFLTTAQVSFPDQEMSNRAIEMIAMHRDGHEFPVEATVWQVRAGGTRSFNGFVRDISQRRRAEEARRKQTTLVQLLQLVTDAANRSSSIEDAAQATLKRICAHTGWPVGHVYLQVKDAPEDLISARLWHVEGDISLAAFRAASEGSYFSSGAGLPGCVLASGKPQWIASLAGEDPSSERIRAAIDAGLRSGFGFPVLVEEKVIGVLEFFSIQTVQPDEELLSMLGHIGLQLGQVIIRQRAEEDLQRAKASAESANRAKSEFLTTMSHEMRTPMNAILGMAEVLAESSLSEEQRQYVRISQTAGASLLDLINDLLDLSKVESGQFELASIGFDLRSILERVIEMMASRAHDRGLPLTLEILPGVPSGLVGDPRRLRQILVNLIGNALKFTERGSVTLRVEPEPGGAEGWLLFNIVDTGIGIAEGKMEMIFNRFTQADSSLKRKHGGTGLGLAISKSLTELLGGRIGCTSEVGKGSTFFFTLPFEIRQEVPYPDKPAAIPIPPARPAGQYPAARILIVEDFEFNVALLKAYLKDCGFELDFAENGEIAVEKVTTSVRPDLVLMDLQMPVMDGLEATRAIRRWEETVHSRPIPILALTAHAMGEGIGDSLEAGCTEHLTKPIEKETLLDAISRHLGGKIHITPPVGFEDVVPSYLAQIRSDIDRILAGVNSKDYIMVHRLGRQFKGTGQCHGFPEITWTGAALELAAMAADEDEIRSQIVALGIYLDRVEVAAI